VEFESEEFEEKLIELLKNMPVYSNSNNSNKQISIAPYASTEALYDVSTKAFSDRVKTAAALKHFSGNERRWLVYHTSQCSTENKNTTDLLRADWLYTVQLGQLHCRSSATVELGR